MFSPHSLGVAGILVGFVLGSVWSFLVVGRNLGVSLMCLAIAALLIGYIAEKETKRRARSAGLRRARAEARSHERARIARELHDGVVQSLSAAELHMDVIRRQVAPIAPQQADALLNIQQRFRDDVKDLRLLTRRMQTSRTSSLTEDLAGIVDRFRRETGMSVTFACDATSAELSAPARHEIGRIVQEALVNIRKHSGAHHVAVRAGVADGRWVISIQDDGRGFPFAGRWSHWQLDRADQGPFVIKQRARAVNATLSLESTPGKGSRLELAVPLRS